MFGAWLVYLICLIFYFRDPPKPMEAPMLSKTAGIELTGEKTALLSDEEVAESASPPLYKNVPVMVTLVIYFVIKLALECALSSTATLTAFYFDWGPQSSGMYLALLGLIMFPANLLVAYFSRQYDDRELILATLVLLLVGLWGIVDYGHAEYYSLAQYVIFGVIIFVSSNAVEGPNMALLSKTIPKSWARGLFNVGLLSTEAGTLGRAIGDVFITWCGLGGLENLLNHMFITLGVLAGATVGFTYQAYSFLEPSDKDD
jgi:Na+/melibiose symporter-like transporter